MKNKILTILLITSIPVLSIAQDKSKNTLDSVCKSNNNFISRTLDIPKWYDVDWNKVKTFEQMKIILKAFQIKVPDNHQNIKELSPFLKSYSDGKKD